MDQSLAELERGYEDLFQVEKGSQDAGVGVIDDPYPVWAELLAKGPVHEGAIVECMGLPLDQLGPSYRPDQRYFSVFGFAAVSDVFLRKEDFSSEMYFDLGMVEQFGDSILNMDGPRHRRYRNLVQAHFQPAAAEGWWREKVIAPLVDDLIGRFETEAGVDLNAQFFARLPLHTVTDGFGMSWSQGIDFRQNMLRGVQSGGGPQERIASMQAAGRILGEVIRERRRAPQDDLISRLAHADLEEEDGGSRKLTDEEIASFCRLIVFAGGETTWRQLGIAGFALLSHPDQLAEVIADPSLLSAAILESTRWNPDPLFMRKVRRDTVLHGVELPKGAILHLCLGAANRDPSRWERPDQYDIHRPFQRSVAFAAGHHSCLGQHVARQEMEAALAGLFVRFPKIRWDPSKAPARLTGSLFQRGPGPLNVLLH
jgi:cytochrome P450